MATNSTAVTNTTTIANADTAAATIHRWPPQPRPQLRQPHRRQRQPRQRSQRRQPRLRKQCTTQLAQRWHGHLPTCPQRLLRRPQKLDRQITQTPPSLRRLPGRPGRRQQKQQRRRPLLRQRHVLCYETVEITGATTNAKETQTHEYVSYCQRAHERDHDIRYSKRCDHMFLCLNNVMYNRTSERRDGSNDKLGADERAPIRASTAEMQTRAR